MQLILCAFLLQAFFASWIWHRRRCRCHCPNLCHSISPIEPVSTSSHGLIVKLQLLPPKPCRLPLTIEIEKAASSRRQTKKLSSYPRAVLTTPLLEKNARCLRANWETANDKRRLCGKREDNKRQRVWSMPTPPENKSHTSNNFHHHNHQGIGLRVTHSGVLISFGKIMTRWKRMTQVDPGLAFANVTYVCVCVCVCVCHGRDTWFVGCRFRVLSSKNCDTDENFILRYTILGHHPFLLPSIRPISTVQYYRYIFVRYLLAFSWSFI